MIDAEVAGDTVVDTAPTPRQRQAAAVERWLRVFHPLPGEVVEIVATNVRGRDAVCQASSDLGKLAAMAVELDAAEFKVEEARAIYLWLNPLKPEMDGFAKSARKGDVTCRHWLMIDSDPVREARTNSTDAERAAAWGVLDRCRGLLDAAGLTAAVVADSGNGWHLFYPIDLPNDDASQALIKGVLAGLGERCGDANAEVDSETFKATQAGKCYGTRVRKGPHSPERPHRWARLIDPASPWDAATAAANTAVLRDLPASWQAQKDLRRGRPGDEAATPAAERARRYVEKMPPGIAGQRGHDATYLAAQVLARGFALPRELSWPILQQFNGRCQPPWSEPELVHKIDSAEKDSKLPLGYLLNGAAPANGVNGHHPAIALPAVPKSAAEPEPWAPPVPLNAPPAVPPFPLGVLPGPLRQFVEELAWATNAPPDFAAVPLLAVAGGAIGNSRRLAVTRSHHQSACLWAAIVGRPGSGKSTPLDFVLRPLIDAERRFRREGEQAKIAWKAEDAETRGDAPKVRRCLIDDATAEAAVRVLNDNPRGVLMAKDELAAMVTGMNQYKQQGGSDRQMYLKVWSGQTIQVDRNKLEGVPLFVRRPFMAIVGGIQPTVIDGLRGERQEGRPPPNDGFLDRFLLAYPTDAAAVGEQWREVSEYTARAWSITVEGLLGLDMQIMDDGDLVPRLMPLTSEAKLVWTRETQRHADQLNATDFPEFLRGAWCKLSPGYAGRLSLIVQLLRWCAGDGDEGAVDARAVEAAFQLVDYFKAHARKTYAFLGADPLAAEAQHILEWIVRLEVKEFSRRDAYLVLRNTFSSPPAMDRPLGRLVDHGYLRPVETEQKGPGRKASQRYLVNPLGTVTKCTECTE